MISVEEGINFDRLQPTTLSILTRYCAEGGIRVERTNHALTIPTCLH
jgi:hypothetical protein